MTSKIDMREALVEMEKVLSRRDLFFKVAKGVGVAAIYDRFGPALLGAGPGAAAETAVDPFQQALSVFGAFGRLVIPVDEDPGWATFEPDITLYGLDVYERQVFSLGNDLAFSGFTAAVVAFNEVPPLIGYGPKFLDMNLEAQGGYLYQVLSGGFENDGVQDIVSFAGVFMLLGVKQVFFLNFPRHLATPGAEYQKLTGFTPKTGWDIMGFKGPVGPDEEKALRTRSENAQELPGVDWRNPYI